MDIKLSGVEATTDERAAIDAVLGPPRSGWRGGAWRSDTDGRVAHAVADEGARRDLLLPALHAAQDRVGYVSRGALDYICLRLTVPPAEAWGVLTFYHLLASEPRPTRVVHVCDDIACRIRGATDVCRELERVMGPAGAAAANADTTWLRSPCLGQCERAPAALVIEAGERPRAYAVAPVTGVAAVLDRAAESFGSSRDAQAGSDRDAKAARLIAVRVSVPQAGDPSLRLLRRAGTVDPGSLAAYRDSGGYRALDRAFELGPARVVEEVVAANLVGRGGAAFPTGRKWQAVASALAHPHYLVCNADESEPGTFKDRVLLEEDPFAILEAMTIAGFATGCERGYLYLRGEYPLAASRLASAIEQARSAGLLGANVAGAGFAFDIEVRRGAGAYICGEETALFNSIEGKRGEPRSKPPFPTEVGLFGKPTLVNNVETLANVALIVLEGGAAFSGIGSGASRGPKLFCVSGHVARPGVYEVPFGVTLGETIEQAGGVREGARLQAVLLGGAAGAFVGADALALPLTFEGTRAAGASLGSGVVMVFDQSVDLSDILLRIASFFRHESCGQCVPCRVGTVRQEELLQRLQRGSSAASRPNVLETLRELSQAMRDASICGLGQTASAAIESALKQLDPFSTRAEA